MLSPEGKVESKDLALVLGGLCLFDVVFVKVPYSKSELVNQSIPRYAGPAIGLAGIGLLAYSFS